VKLSDIAEQLGCELRGDGNLEITAVVGIENADAGHITFVSNPKYAGKVKNTKASAIIVSPDFPDLATATLRHANPYLAFARSVELFYTLPQPPRNIDSAARIASSAKIGEGASIAPFVVIDNNVEIGANCTLHPFVHIGQGAKIGDNFKAYANVSTVLVMRSRPTVVTTRSCNPELSFWKTMSK